MYVEIPIIGAEHRNIITQIISNIPVRCTFSDFIYFFTTNIMRLSRFRTAKIQWLTDFSLIRNGYSIFYPHHPIEPEKLFRCSPNPIVTSLKNAFTELRKNFRSLELDGVALCKITKG